MWITLRFIQFINACFPIVFTEAGISIDFNSLQETNASSAIAVIPSGIIVVWQPNSNLFSFVSIIALLLFRESNVGLFTSTVIRHKYWQPCNHSDNVLTDEGKYIDFRLLLFVP